MNTNTCEMSKEEFDSSEYVFATIVMMAAMKGIGLRQDQCSAAMSLAKELCDGLSVKDIYELKEIYFLSLQLGIIDKLLEQLRDEAE